MKTPFDIEKLIANGCITNELDYERALIADRNLRLMAKEDGHFKILRSQLRDIIELYEKVVWSDVDQIDDHKILESDLAEQFAERERQFIQKRKNSIRKKLKALDLTQENLASILGHKSKTHMSELMNGIKPFSLKDLIIIHRLFHIEVSILVPVFISKEDQMKVKQALEKLDKPTLKLSADDLTLGY